jgi:hypothetical protein
MKSYQWIKIAELFHEALQLPENDRENFLVAAGNQYPDLVVELRKLIQSHFDSGSFLTGTATDKITDPNEPF